MLETENAFLSISCASLWMWASFTDQSTLKGQKNVAQYLCAGYREFHYYSPGVRVREQFDSSNRCVLPPSLYRTLFPVVCYVLHPRSRQILYHYIMVASRICYNATSCFEKNWILSKAEWLCYFWDVDRDAKFSTFALQKQLSVLLEKLHGTATSFIRCLKPNQNMSDTQFEGKVKLLYHLNIHRLILFNYLLSTCSLMEKLTAFIY